MQISSVSAQNFNGKSSNIDSLLGQNDKVLREYAIDSALNSTNYKKQRKINNALWYSAPVAGFLAGALLHKGPEKFFSKEITGASAKVLQGLKRGGMWALALLTADAFVGLYKHIMKKSENSDNFVSKHPGLTSLATIAASCLTLFYLPKGINKLYSKYGSNIAKLADKVKLGKFFKADTYVNGSKIFNSSKFTAAIKKPLNKLSQKAPSYVKNVAKAAVDIAPEALIFTSLGHAIHTSFSLNRKANNTYNTLKEKQANLIQQKMTELQVENDFLKMFPENEENLKLLHSPFEDLPKDIQIKLAEKFNLNPEKNYIE